MFLSEFVFFYVLLFPPVLCQHDNLRTSEPIVFTFLSLIHNGYGKIHLSLIHHGYGKIHLSLIHHGYGKIHLSLIHHGYGKIHLSLIHHGYGKIHLFLRGLRGVFGQSFTIQKFLVLSINTLSESVYEM